MSAPPKSSGTAIDDARTLLDTLLASDWQDIHVVSGDTEIFIARDGGRSNPMRLAPAADTAAIAVVEPAAPVTGNDATVTAPHVATIVSLPTVGSHIESGAALATIRVLDADDIVAAPQSGTVTVLHAAVGDLIEFKAPILSLGAPSR
jgi:biotin carboxyl carrier protein